MKEFNSFYSIEVPEKSLNQYNNEDTSLYSVLQKKKKKKKKNLDM